MNGNQDVISSISKGCFHFKPEVKKKRKKSNVKNEAFSYMPSFSNESKEERERRYQTLHSTWDHLEAQVRVVQDSLNESVFQDVLKYIQNVHSTGRETSTNREIPTAALVTGVNIPDHEAFFSQFAHLLKEKVSPLVSQLHSKVCSNLKSLLRCTFDSLTLSPEDNLDDTQEDELEDELLDDSDEESQPLKRRKRKKTAHKIFKKYTFTEFKMWYSELCLRNTSKHDFEENNENVKTGEMGLNSTYSAMEKPPILIIFEDFERFSPSVLQDFILICSEYISELPLLLVFGLNTAVSSVHRVLPHSVSSKLTIQKFQSQPSIVCLRNVIDRVIIADQSAFKLGPRVFRLLYEHFIYHDFSINNFVRGLKFCVLDHFSSSPITILCTKNVDDIIAYISDQKNLKRLQQVDSFKKFIEKKSESEQKRLASNGELVVKGARILISKLKYHEEHFYPIVKCLYFCTSKLPGSPFGKWLRDVYEYCVISPNISKEQRFSSAMGLLRVLSRDELISIVKNCKTVLEMGIISKGKDNPLKAEAATLEKLEEKFRELDKFMEESVEDSVHSNVLKPKQVFKSRTDFKEQMKLAVKEKKKETPYEKLRSSVVDYLEGIFRRYLNSPLSMPFHEIFYYDDFLTVKKTLNGTPRVAIQKALSNPQSYFQCSCCDANSDEINKSMPDICILYKLHLESGRMINLYDWMQAFISYVDPTIIDGKKKKKSEKKKKTEEQLQARFIRGISELQFLGFIKGTKRKTDHVSRLTWGSC